MMWRKVKNILIGVLPVVITIICARNGVSRYKIATEYSNGSLTISPDGSRLGFVYEDQKTRKVYVQINNIRLGPFDGVDRMQFSANGKKFAFGFTKGDKYYYQLDGKQYGPFDHSDKVYGQDIIIGNDNIAITYYNKNKYFVQTANRKYGPYDYVDNVCFSSDKDHIRFMFKGGQSSYIQIHNAIYGPFKPFDYTLRFAPYDTGFAFVFRDTSNSSQWYVQVNNKKYGPYDRVDDLKFSQSGMQFGFWFRKNNQEYIQINDTIFGPYSRIFYDYRSPPPMSSYYGLQSLGCIKFSSDGRSFGFWYEKNSLPFLRVNDKEYAMSIDSTDYKHLGSYHLMPEGDPHLRRSRLIFSPNGNMWALWYCDKRLYYVRINENVYGPFGRVGDLRFSAEGDRYGFLYGDSTGWYIRYGNDSFGPYGKVLPCPSTFFQWQLYSLYSHYVPHENQTFPISYIVCKNNINCIFLDGCLYGPFDYSLESIQRTVRLSPNGKVFGFYVENWHDGVRGYTLCINDKKFGPYEDASDFQFSFTNTGKIVVAYITHGYIYHIILNVE